MSKPRYQRQHCVNCGIVKYNNIIRMYLLEDEDILSVIQQWNAPAEINSSHYICLDCKHLAVNSSGSEKPLLTTIAHRQVCIGCGRSMINIRCYELNSDLEKDNMIYSVISKWYEPNGANRSINECRVCHPCRMKATREIDRRTREPSSTLHNESCLQEEFTTFEQESESIQYTTTLSSNDIPSRNNSIVLPDYVRATETERNCFITRCQGKERNSVPLTIRKMLLCRFNLYVPSRNRLCNKHLNTESWDFINELSQHYINEFTADHIQDMFEIFKI